MNSYIVKIIETGKGRKIEFNEIYSNLSEYPEGGLNEGLTTQETTSKTTSKTPSKANQTGGQIDIKYDSDIEFQSIFGESAVYFGCKDFQGANDVG